MSTFTIDTQALPSHADLSTSHWAKDQQIQFSKAAEGVRHAPWFQKATSEMPEADKERAAKAFAFAALGECRRRMRLAPDDELILDNRGLGR